MRVRFTPTGRAQFLAAIAYIRRENPTAAIRFRQRAEQTLRRLEQFPESGRVVPEFPDLPYREVIVSPYRFFYRIKEAEVWREPSLRLLAEPGCAADALQPALLHRFGF